MIRATDLTKPAGRSVGSVPLVDQLGHAAGTILWRTWHHYPDHPALCVICDGKGHRCVRTVHDGDLPLIEARAVTP